MVCSLRCLSTTIRTLVTKNRKFWTPHKKNEIRYESSWIINNNNNIKKKKKKKKKKKVGEKKGVVVVLGGGGKEGRGGGGEKERGGEKEGERGGGGEGGTTETRMSIGWLEVIFRFYRLLKKKKR